MPKSYTHVYTNAILQFQVVQDGKEVNKSVTLSRINPFLTAEEVHEVANKLFALTKHELEGVHRVVRESIA